MNDDTKAQLLAHADELKKTFGVTLEEQPLLQKDAGTTIGAIGLALAVADSIKHGVLHDLIIYLQDLKIPEEQILRLRLDEPENILEVLHGGKTGDRHNVF